MPFIHRDDPCGPGGQSLGGSFSQTDYWHDLGASSFDRQPWPGDGNISEEAHRHTPATAQRVEALSDGWASATGSVSPDER